MKKVVEWKWGVLEEESFWFPLGKLTSAALIMHLDVMGGVILHTDASLAGLGAVLSQGEGLPENEVSFMSRPLTDPDKRCTAKVLECLAVVWAIGKLLTFFYAALLRAIKWS